MANVRMGHSPDDTVKCAPGESVVVTVERCDGVEARYVLIDGDEVVWTDYGLTVNTKYTGTATFFPFVNVKYVSMRSQVVTIQNDADDSAPVNGGPGTNSGHGYVWERPDGMRARCGGPAICDECRHDKAAWTQDDEVDV